MNKRIVVLLAILAAPSAVFGMAEQAMSDEQKQKIKDQKYKEWKYYHTAGDVGRFVGGAVGGIAGARFGTRLAEKAGVDVTKDEKDFWGNPKLTKKGIAIAYTGLATGAYAGGKLGARIGKTAAAAYYARKYGVSLSIAELAFSLELNLASPNIRKAFIAAESKNDYSFLRGFLIIVYESLLGPNWRSILKQMLENDELNFYLKHLFSKDKEIVAQAENFMYAAKITWALGMLYFGDNIYFTSSGYDNIIATTKKLLKALEKPIKPI